MIRHQRKDTFNEMQVIKCRKTALIRGPLSPKQETLLQEYLVRGMAKKARNGEYSVPLAAFTSVHNPNALRFQQVFKTKFTKSKGGEK